MSGSLIQQTIPEEYRPSSRASNVMYYAASSGGGGIGRIDVEPSGQIKGVAVTQYGSAPVNIGVSSKSYFSGIVSWCF